MNAKFTLPFPVGEQGSNLKDNWQMLHLANTFETVHCSAAFSCQIWLTTWKKSMKIEIKLTNAYLTEGMNWSAAILSQW